MSINLNPKSSFWEFSKNYDTVKMNSRESGSKAVAISINGHELDFVATPKDVERKASGIENGSVCGDKFLCDRLGNIKISFRNRREFKTLIKNPLTATVVQLLKKIDVKGSFEDDQPNIALQLANIYTNPKTPKALKKSILESFVSPALREGMLEYASARYGVSKDELKKIMPQGENFEFIGVGKGSFVTNEADFQRDIDDKTSTFRKFREKPQLTSFGNSGWKYALLKFPKDSGEADKLYLCPPDTQNSGFVDTFKEKSKEQMDKEEPLSDDIKSAIASRLPGLTKAHEIGKAIGLFKLFKEDAQTQQRFSGGLRALGSSGAPEEELQKLSEYHKKSRKELQE